MRALPGWPHLFTSPLGFNVFLHMLPSGLKQDPGRDVAYLPGGRVQGEGSEMAGRGRES